MTGREFLRSELLKSLDLILKPEGFSLNKGQAEFVKVGKDGWLKYQIIFLKNEEGWEISLGMLIRKNVVEDIFHKTSGFESKYQKGTPTIASSIEDYLGDRSDKYRFSLTQESEIDEIASKVLLLYKDVAVPFFKKYFDLKSLDDAMNENPEDISLTGAIFKGSKGIILAKLMKRDDYENLAQIYTKQYEVLSNGFYLPAFKNLIAYLQSIPFIPDQSYS